MKNKTILNQLVKISYLEEKNEDLILSDNFLRQNLIVFQIYTNSLKIIKFHAANSSYNMICMNYLSCFYDIVRTKLLC